MNERFLNREFELNNAGVSNAFDTVHHSRHRWYYYKEGFSPSLVEKAIQEYGQKSPETILDPFNGSGTVTLTATANNIKSIGIEVNPFTTFISKSKLQNTNANSFNREFENVINALEKRTKSSLEGFSTFSPKRGSSKWLFNTSVIRTFQSGINSLNDISSESHKDLFKLALLHAAMENCNAKKDGKCLRYYPKWQEMNLNQSSFISSFERKVQEIIDDTGVKLDTGLSTVINGDSRKAIEELDTFDICITSPPYANTFDYSDIYRPELFLGQFVKNNEELYNLRLKTVRSHIQAKWEAPKKSLSSIILRSIIDKLSSNTNLLMHKNIPQMIEAYFEDMDRIFKSLYDKGKSGSQVWLVVANSAYANVHLPVDLILAEIATECGWKLKEIGVLREIKKRKTKYSPDVESLRESAIILDKP